MVEQGRRILAIDALRGFDMFWLIVVDAFFHALEKAWPNGFSQTMSTQLHHVDVGLHLYDLLFPTFVFLAGCSWPFSLASQQERGCGRGQITLRIFKRFVLLFFLGAVLFGFMSFDFNHVRFNSIFGRIGFGWAVAALATLYLPRRWWIVGVTVFAVYWLAMQFGPGLLNPGADPWTWNPDNMIAVFDRWIGKPPPDRHGGEGFFTAIGCIPTAFLGVWAGKILKRTDVGSGRKMLELAGVTVILAVLGALAALTCPCMKPMWNPTFILVAGAFSTGFLALFHWLIDVRGFVAWSFPFRVIGMNAMIIFFLNAYVPFKDMAHQFLCGVESWLPAVWTAPVDCAGRVLLSWLLLYFLYRKKTFLKV